MTWDAAAAEASAAEAENELQLLIGKMTPEERAGLEKFQAWWKKWYNGNAGKHATGHKALAHIFIRSVHL